MTSRSGPLWTALPNVSAIVIVLLLIVTTGTGWAGEEGDAVSGGHVACASDSFDESRFLTTVRQRYDFSCGAAALATLLIYHYQEPVTEHEVVEAMLAAGDRTKIRAQGFSMLDMKRYLEERGLDSAGYEVSLDRLAAIGLPAIVLLSYDGLNHFVVVKGVAGSDILIGDPAVGLRVISREEFESAWNGLIFVIRSKTAVGRSHFNRKTEWFLGTHPVVEAAPEEDVPSGSVQASRDTFSPAGRP